MKAPTPKEVVNEWFERVWNSRDKAAIDRMMTEDAVAHRAGGAQVCGTTQFSDFQDKLIGDFVGIGPTNKKVNFSGMSFVTVRDGKITEGWDCWDHGSLTTTLSSPSA